MNLLREYIKEVMETVPQIPPESQIFCDMDGVLVDFETAVIALLNNLLDGGSLTGVKRTKGHFARLNRLKQELGLDWRPKDRSDLDIKIVRNFMMGSIGANPGPVYANMPAHADAISQLWPFLNSTGHIVNLLTAPINARTGAVMTSGEGKKIWAEQLDPPPSDIIVTPARQKAEYATVGGVPNILIDDRASTVDAWNDATEAAGFGRGFGILHIPRNSGGTIIRLQELGL